MLFRNVAERVAVNEWPGESGEGPHCIVHTGERRGLNIHHISHAYVAVFGHVKPKHRVVAQTDVVETNGENHEGHRRDELRLSLNGVPNRQDILAFVGGKLRIKRRVDRDLRVGVRRLGRYVAGFIGLSRHQFR